MRLKVRKQTQFRVWRADYLQPAATTAQQPSFDEAAKPIIEVSSQERVGFETASGRMVVNILGVMAQWERETIGERTASAMAYKRREGTFCGSKRAPYGYSNDNGRVKPDPAEQHVLTEIRAMRAAKVSLRRVVAKLNEQGCSCPRWRGLESYGPRQCPELEDGSGGPRRRLAGNDKSIPMIGRGLPAGAHLAGLPARRPRVKDPKIPIGEAGSRCFAASAPKIPKRHFRKNLSKNFAIFSPEIS